AEDGIRDFHVTGVQTCALPICRTNLLSTRDGGNSWQLLGADAVPAPLEGEGAFAASGGCVTSYGERHGWVATGGPGARLFRTEEIGRASCREEGEGGEGDDAGQ